MSEWKFALAKPQCETKFESECECECECESSLRAILRYKCETVSEWE